MKTIEVVFLEELKVYFDGFTCSEFNKGDFFKMESSFAEKYIAAGICKAFKEREVKPAVIKKETKVAKVVRKTK